MSEEMRQVLDMLSDMRGEIRGIKQSVENTQNKVYEIDRRLVIVETAVKGNGTDGLYDIVKNNRKRIEKLNGFITKVALWFTAIGIILGLVGHRLINAFKL